MRNTQIMLKFLFYALLGLLIFVPTCIWGSQFFKVSAKASNDYVKLVEIINNIDENELLSTPVYMEKKSVIVGFSKDADRFETHQYYPLRDNPDAIEFYFDRPESCEKPKACVCLCQEYTFKVGGDKPFYKECEEPQCKSIKDDVDILPEKIISRVPASGKPKNYWKGGFLFLRDVPAVANELGVKNMQATRTFYIERYKDIVSVCLEDDCITDEIKVQIDKS